MEAFYEEWKVRPVLISNWTEVISFQSNIYSPMQLLIFLLYDYRALIISLSW